MRWPILGALLSQLAENVSEKRYAMAQLVEIRLGNDQDVHGGAGPNRGISGPVGKHRHFPEIFSVAPSRQELPLAFPLAQSLALAFLDDIHAVTQITLLEDVARLEMLIPDAGFN